MVNIHLSTVRKDVQNYLKEYSIEELLINVRKNLKELREYPEHNKNQLKYYTKFWLVLSEF